MREPPDIDNREDESTDATQAQPERALLILDGHSSRHNLDLMDWLAERGVDVIILPSHSSEFLQPLDQLPNKKWKEGLCGVSFPSRRKNERGRDHFLDRVFAAIDSAMNSECIRNGFKMAGLILASPSKMLAKLTHEHSNPTSIAQELDNMENPDSEWETGRWRHNILEDGTMEEHLVGPIESTETIGDVSATGLFPISGHVITDPEFLTRWRHHQQGKILKKIDASMKKQERRMKLELKRLDHLLKPSGTIRNATKKRFRMKKEDRESSSVEDSDSSHVTTSEQMSFSQTDTTEAGNGEDTDNIVEMDYDSDAEFDEGRERDRVEQNGEDGAIKTNRTERTERSRRTERRGRRDRDEQNGEDGAIETNRTERTARSRRTERRGRRDRVEQNGEDGETELNGTERREQYGTGSKGRDERDRQSNRLRRAGWTGSMGRDERDRQSNRLRRAGWTGSMGRDERDRQEQSIEKSGMDRIDGEG
ncbi:hypothetical protein BLNAU_19754 [Blattamonas nauphoetae]|uniref:DDE-1 domain-containing protein n=1 Tax=Blattamonas nauphoetae TaxID=2049346 RepID=A0ABQ9X3T5_9EUKA|nr:hypothetical protein BLNAU_19754 [Blattamonas nauphoetae]